MLHNGLQSLRRNFFFTDIFQLFILFKRLFSPSSWSPMSKLFRFLESFGKSIGHKWSQIWKLLIIKGAKKKLYFGEFCLTSRILLVSVLLTASRDSLYPVCWILYLYLRLIQGNNAILKQTLIKKKNVYIDIHILA